MALNPQSVLTKLDLTTPEQLSALSYLKNEVIGHAQRKEDWIRYGVARSIVRIIASRPLGSGEKDAPSSFLTLPTFTDEDNAKLQALQLLASFANGMQPLVSSSSGSTIITLGLLL